jgi:hypothetical protein
MPGRVPDHHGRDGQRHEGAGPDADKVQVLFVTVDPERDTQEVLAQYVPAFDKRFLGLRGDLPQTEKVAKEFKVFYQKVRASSRAATRWITPPAAMCSTRRAHPPVRQARPGTADAGA